MALTSTKRNAAAVDLMKAVIDLWIADPVEEAPELDAEAAGLLMDLWEGQAAREGAFVLLALSLVEERPLNLVDQAAGDLKADTPRVAGDRAISEALSKRVLRPLGVPATQGVFQSSTYRAGYAAPQAANATLARFAQWASAPDRKLEELDALFQNLAKLFADEAFVVPELPAFARQAFTFAAFSELISRLLGRPSQGAFQQYLFAALLAEYVDSNQFSQSLRVATKPLFQSDRSANTAGDVEVRAGQNLQAVYEVSANNWRTKLAQAIEAVTTRDELTSITILAPAPAPGGAEIASTIAGSALPSGVDASRLDIAVLGIYEECASIAARLPRRERENVVRRLYDYLVLFCRTQPELVTTLLEELAALGLSEPPPSQEAVITPV